MSLNPFILKEKRKLVEGKKVGDLVEISWIFRNASNPTEMTLKGKITELTDWIAIQGDSKVAVPITALTSCRDAR